MCPGLRIRRTDAVLRIVNDGGHRAAVGSQSGAIDDNKVVIKRDAARIKQGRIGAKLWRAHKSWTTAPEPVSHTRVGPGVALAEPIVLTRFFSPVTATRSVWAAIVHAFQGRTVDHVIAAMESNHPHLGAEVLLRPNPSRPPPRRTRLR